MKYVALFISLFLLPIGCSNQTDAPIVAAPTEAIEAEPIATAIPTSVPEPTPEPTATPAPSYPTFVDMRSIIELLDFEQQDEYLASVNGNEVADWVGKVVEKDLLDNGKFGVTLEMDETPLPRPDLILSGIPKDEYETLQTGDTIRFSGKIAGLTIFGDQKRIPMIDEAKLEK